MAMQLLENRYRNRYAANCSDCRTLVEIGTGYLFKNTKYRNSKGYHVKCQLCYDGTTEKLRREADRLSRPKTLSLTFAKKWVKSLNLVVTPLIWAEGTAEEDRGQYVRVKDGEEVILGWLQIIMGMQEYPNEDWTQEQAERLGGQFSDSAVTYIIETLTPMIEALKPTYFYHNGQEYVKGD